MKRIPLISYFFANLISLVGNNLTMIAVPWFVLETTGSAFQTGLVAFFTALPAILAAFFGGTIVDRFGQKRMSIISDLASGITVLLIPLLYGTRGLQFWQLLLLVFLSALLDGPGNTARQALLPELALAANLPLEKANAVQQAIHRAGTLIGPAMAGFLIVWLGSSNVLWLDAATFAVSAGLFALAIPSGQPRVKPESRYFKLLQEGWQFVRRDRLIIALCVTIAITNFLDTPLFAVVLPVYAEQVYGQATALGLLISSFGAGALIGSLLFGLVIFRAPRRITFVVAFIFAGMPFWALAFMPPFFLALAALFCGGVAAGQLNPLIMTLVQERTPAALRGRVFGIITALALIAAPLGMVLAGFLTEWLGVIVVLLIIALIYLLVTLAQVFNSAWSEMNRVVVMDKLSDIDTMLH
jgi:MFS family permease